MLLSGEKGNGTGPSAASAIQAFILLVCFHWQQSEGGLENMQRCEDEDKSTGTKEELYIFLCSGDKAKNRGRQTVNDGIVLD